MRPETNARIDRLACATTGRTPTNRDTSEASLRRYLATAGLGSEPRTFVWGGDAVDALCRATALVVPRGVAPEVLRDPRIREATVAAHQRTWPDDTISGVAADAWKSARDQAQLMARNVAWETAVRAWADTLSGDRFAAGSLAGKLLSALPPHAVDAHLGAVDASVYPEAAEGRDGAWIALHEPLLDAFCAGVSRFWVLAEHVVVVPR